MEPIVTSFDYGGFAGRLKEAIFPEKVTAFAERVGLPHATVSKYLNATGTAGPRLDIVARMAEAAGVSLDWLVFARGDGARDEMPKIPRYDVRLAAGVSSWNEGRRQVEDVPVSPAFLQQLGRPTTANLAILQGRGDSMYPTIADDAFIVVDQGVRDLFDDIFAFVLAGEARVKRIRRLTDGVVLISDNEAYPMETLKGEDMAPLQIIGQVLGVLQAV